MSDPNSQQQQHNTHHATDKDANEQSHAAPAPHSQAATSQQQATPLHFANTATPNTPTSQFVNNTDLPASPFGLNATLQQMNITPQILYNMIYNNSNNYQQPNNGQKKSADDSQDQATPTQEESQQQMGEGQGQNLWMYGAAAVAAANAAMPNLTNQKKEKSSPKSGKKRKSTENLEENPAKKKKIAASSSQQVSTPVPQPSSPLTPVTKGTRAHKGLRHFSGKVCEKVQQKGTTSYNEVANELVNEIMTEQNLQQTDEKNIRRRVYDALNVLLALNIITKDKKDIHWKGYPVNYQQELDVLQDRKREREETIRRKKQILSDLMRQQAASANLYNRNGQPEYATVDENSRVNLPFIIVHTSKETVIECEMDEESTEVFFNFNMPFEIHDDNEILYRLGLDAATLTPQQQQEFWQQQEQQLRAFALQMQTMIQAGTASDGSILPDMSAIVQNAAVATDQQQAEQPTTTTTTMSNGDHT